MKDSRQFEELLSPQPLSQNPSSEVLTLTEHLFNPTWLAPELLNEKQQSLQDTIIKFTQTHLAPYSQEWDKQEYFPIEALREAGKLGLGGIYSSPKYGGLNLGRLDTSVVVEALATGNVGFAAYISIHNMTSWILDK